MRVKNIDLRNKFDPSIRIFGHPNNKAYITNYLEYDKLIDVHTTLRAYPFSLAYSVGLIGRFPSTRDINLKPKEMISAVNKISESWFGWDDLIRIRSVRNELKKSMVTFSKEFFRLCNILSLELEMSLSLFCRKINISKQKGSRILNNLKELNLVTVEKKSSQKNSPLSIRLTNRFFTDLCGIKSNRVKRLLDKAQHDCLEKIKKYEYERGSLGHLKWASIIKITGLSALYFKDIDYLIDLKNKLRIQLKSLKQQNSNYINDDITSDLNMEINWIKKLLHKDYKSPQCIKNKDGNL